MAKVEIVNESNFRAAVEESSGPVLVDFYAEWCGPCKMLHPQLEKLAENRKDITVAAVNVDENNNLAERFNISNVPCMLLFKHGEVAKTILGYRTSDQLEALINE